MSVNVGQRKDWEAWYRSKRLLTKTKGHQRVESLYLGHPEGMRHIKPRHSTKEVFKCGLSSEGKNYFFIK